MDYKLIKVYLQVLKSDLDKVPTNTAQAIAYNEGRRRVVEETLQYIAKMETPAL